MLLPLRLTIRRIRFELLIFAGASLALAAITVLLAAQVAHAVHPPPCAATGECEPPGQGLALLGLVPYARLALICLPALAGIIVGTSLVAGELEHRTSVFAWSIALSRRRWLAETTAAAVCALIAVSIPLAIASAVLGQALGPQLDATSSSGIDPSAILLLARPIATFGIATLIGIVVARSLPTLLLAMLATCLVLGALELTFVAWREAEAAEIDVSASGVFYISDAAVASDGQILPISEAFATAEALGKPLNELYRPVNLGLTPQARAWVVAAEVSLTAAAGGLALLVAGFLAERRRPV